MRKLRGVTEMNNTEKVKNSNLGEKEKTSYGASEKKTKKTIKCLNNRFIVIFGSAFLVGAVVIGIMFSIFVAQDKIAAKSAMDKNVEYIRNQCLRYADVSAENQTKSLISIIDKTWQIRHNFENAKLPVSEEMLKGYVADCRFTGILVSSVAGESVKYSYYCDDGLTEEHWQKIFEKFSEVSVFENKVYAERLVGENGYYYDYALIARSDGRGAILCYLRQKAQNAEGTSLSISTLLSGFDIVRGTIAVSEGFAVIASSDPSIIGLSINEGIVGEIVAENKKEEILREEDGQKKFAAEMLSVLYDGKRYFARRETVKNYFIYAFIEESEVFTSSRLKLLYVSMIFFAVWLGVLFVFARSNHNKEVEKLEREVEYAKQIDKLAKEAIRANNAKSEFLRRMSHDIRTPINGIRGMIMIGDYYADDPAKQKECRKKVFETSGYLLELVNDVLDMSKLDEKIPLWEDEKFNIDKILNEVSSMMSFQAAERGITFAFKKENITDAELYGGALALKRVCINLISNAIKYNKENGSVGFKVRQVASDEKTATFELVCADNGMGMSKEFQKIMYEPFAQENSSDFSSRSGTGLGLAIVKSVVDMMGGEIEVKSETGSGTEFKLRLTFFKAESEKNVTETKKYKGSLKDVCVLVAEDNELNMEIAEFMLETAGASVIKAKNGKEAVKIFENSPVGKIKVILMDVMMPVLDGIAATYEIRALNKEDASSVAIIAMTANAYSDDVVTAYKAGMNDYLAKPVESEKLVSTILKFL